MKAERAESARERVDSRDSRRAFMVLSLEKRVSLQIQTRLGKAK